MKTIQDERAQRMRSFNAYRTHFGLRPLRSFDDFGTSPEIRAALAALYPTVDHVDFFVGIMVEQIYEDPSTSSFSEAMLQMVGAFALSAILNFIHVRDPAMSSVERLSQAGWSISETHPCALSCRSMPDSRSSYRAGPPSSFQTHPVPHCAPRTSLTHRKAEPFTTSSTSSRSTRSPTPFSPTSTLATSSWCSSPASSSSLPSSSLSIPSSLSFRGDSASLR